MGALIFLRFERSTRGGGQCFAFAADSVAPKVSECRLVVILGSMLNAKCKRCACDFGMKKGPGNDAACRSSDSALAEHMMNLTGFSFRRSTR